MKAQIELPVAELKMALTGFNKVVGRSRSLPVLQTLRFTREQDGAIQIQGTDLDSFVTYRPEVVQPGPEVEFLVPIEPLAKAVKGSSPKSNIGLIRETKEKLSIRTFAGDNPIDQPLAYIDPKEFPAAPGVDEKVSPLSDEFIK